MGRLYIPAFAGGIFGLLGGYLTDLLGRRRVLTFSILIYAFGAFASGFATSIEMLLVLRCFVFVGVSVEFVAAVAWLAELFPDPTQREKVLGYTQACSSLGGFLVATANGLCVAYATSLPAITSFGSPALADPHATWRYTLMSASFRPALIIIRPFLPESPAWLQKKAAGTLKRPVSPRCSRRIPAHDDRDDGHDGDGALAPRSARSSRSPDRAGHSGGAEMTRASRRRGPDSSHRKVASNVTKMQEVGDWWDAFLAYLAVVIVSRRRLIRTFQIPGLIAMPLIFAVVATSSLTWAHAGDVHRSGLPRSDSSTLGELSAPRTPTHLRGTGEISPPISAAVWSAHRSPG